MSLKSSQCLLHLGSNWTKKTHSVQSSVKTIRFFSKTTTSKMRFVQYTKNDGPQRLGAQLTETSDVIELSAVESSIPNNLVEFLRGGPELMNKAKSIVAESRSLVKLGQVKLLAPITNPDKIICVGLNYKSHCLEQNKPFPEEPFFFSKFPSTIVGPNGDVVHPPNSKALDWEVELGIVMGKRCRNIAKEEITEYIFGYTVSNDISARDWQTPKRNNGQWLFAKSMDTFCPVGPSVVAKEFVSDPQNLGMSSTVNGVEKQRGNTNDMIYGITELVSYLSHCVTLLPGDLILTGTPSGVGVFRNPKEFLKVGDVVTTEIAGLGKLENKIVSES